MSNLVRVSVVLAALAASAALPSVASAENDVTMWNLSSTGVHEGATPVGTKLIGTGNHNAFSKWRTATGEVISSCTTNELYGDLSKNTHTAVEVNITSASFKGKTNQSTGSHTHCSGSSGDTLFTPIGLPWCLQIRAIDATDTFRMRGGSCGVVVHPMDVTTQVTTFLGTMHCLYRRTEPVTGTYVTGTTPVLKVTGSEFTKRLGTCLAEKLFLDLELQLHRVYSGANSGLALTNAT